jgi:hypothetical protein
MTATRGEHARRALVSAEAHARAELERWRGTVASSEQQLVTQRRSLAQAEQNLADVQWALRLLTAADDNIVDCEVVDDSEPV